MRCSPPFSLRSVLGVFVAVWLGSLAVGPVQAQPGAETEDEASPPPIVQSVKIRGNETFSDAELRLRIRTSPNRRVLGIPGFTWWRWVYRLGDAGWMGGRLGNALKAGGEPPAYVDSTTIADDVERLTVFYRQEGFRDATVQAEVRPTDNPERVRVVFAIAPGPATYLRQVRYEGVAVLDSLQRRRLLRDPVIRRRSRPDTLATGFLARNQRYRQADLLEERRRLLRILRNEGYAAVTRDSIRAIVYQAVPDSFDVSFRISPGERYRFGDVQYRVTGPEPEAPVRRDTLRAVPLDSARYTPRITTRIAEESRLESGILRRSLQFDPGAYYSREEVLATKRRLEGTGLFAFTNLTERLDRIRRTDSLRLGPDSVQVDSLRDPYLPLQIDARTRQRHRLRAETFALQRQNVTDVENELGLGVGLTYENVNALGGGETFQARTSASIATGLDSTLVTSAQVEASTSLTLPYLIRPFDRLERVFDLASARTRLSLSFLTARRNDLGLLIRGRGNARLRLEMEHTPTIASLVDVLDLSLSNPDALPTFQTRFINRIFGSTADTTGTEGGIRDPVQRRQILEDYTQPQINSAFRYTLRAATANPLKRKRGYIYEGAVEIGNTLPTLLDRFVFTPDTLEYNLPGFSGGPPRSEIIVVAGDSIEITTNRLIYRPYVRFVADLRRYRPIGRGTTLAYKMYGGFAHPIAGPDVVPFDRRFFSGGATSVRGWRLRDLGPGGAALTRADAAGGVANILGGDVKLEASLELRRLLFRNFLTANWVGAGFLDVGNVWFGPRNPGLGDPAPGADRPGQFRLDSFMNELGVGGGAGVRLEWEYLIVRFDLAWRLHDPSPSKDDVFADDFSGPLLHFGIGHAF